MFYWKVDNEHIIIVIAVDDLTIASNSIALLNMWKCQLESEFTMTDMGPPHWLLGIEIKCN